MTMGRPTVKEEIAPITAKIDTLADKMDVLATSVSALVGVLANGKTQPSTPAQPELETPAAKVTELANDHPFTFAGYKFLKSDRQPASGKSLVYYADGVSRAHPAVLDDGRRVSHVSVNVETAK